jgi:hypothetical protein
MTNINKPCMAHLFCSAFASSQPRRVSKGSSEPCAMSAQGHQHHEGQQRSYKTTTFFQMHLYDMIGLHGQKR